MHRAWDTSKAESLATVATLGPCIHVVKYDRAGTLRWFQQAGSDRTDHAYTIVSDSQDNLYLSGACSGPAKFGSQSIPNRGSNNMFLAKLRANGCRHGLAKLLSP